MSGSFSTQRKSSQEATKERQRTPQTHNKSKTQLKRGGVKGFLGFLDERELERMTSSSAKRDSDDKNC